MFLKTADFESLCTYRTKYDFYYPNKKGVGKKGILYFFDDEIPETVSSFLENYDNVREFGTLNLLWYLEKYNKKAFVSGLFDNEDEVSKNLVFISNVNLN